MQTTTMRRMISSAISVAVLGAAALTATPAAAVGPATFPDAFTLDASAKKITLTADYEATETVKIPGGYTLDGHGNTIYAVGSQWSGPVVTNSGSGAITVTDLTINRITRNAPWVNETANYGNDDRTVAGLLVMNAGLTATNVHIEGIRGSTLNQNGYGILVHNTTLDTSATVLIDGAEISAYTKGGIYIFGQHTTATIQNSTVGGGIDGAATNSILISAGAKSTISDNEITGGQWKKTDAQSAGILFYGAGDTTVEGNTITGADVGIAIDPGATTAGRYAGGTVNSTVTITDNTIAAPSSLLPEGNTPLGITIAAGKTGPVRHTLNTFTGFDPAKEIVDNANVVVTPTFASTPSPVISGAPRPGATLTAGGPAWQPTPAAMAYQWKANGTAIAGATKATYTVTTADLGKTITVTVTGTRPHYASKSATSAATAPIGIDALTATPVPTISGSVRVSRTLTAKPGNWQPAPVTFSYSWYRNGSRIAGAAASTYKLTTADYGKKIVVKVTGTKTGYTPVTKTSQATVKVTRGPIGTATPSISGTVKVGKTLTAKPGGWSPSGIKLGYQWYRDGKAISKATKTTYALGKADLGHKITVKVSATKPYFTPASKTSKATAKVGKGTIAPATPAISGTAKVGKTLTAKPGKWSPSGIKLSYQWYRDGKAVSGATKATYKLSGADRGHKITVKVIASKSAYTTASRTSTATAKVAG